MRHRPAGPGGRRGGQGPGPRPPAGTPGRCSQLHGRLSGGAMASQDSGTSGSACPELEPRQKPNFSPAVSTPRGRKGFVLKRVRAWPAGRAFKRSSSDLLAADPRGAGRLLLSRPRPPVFTEPHESELSASGIPSPTRVKDHFQNRLSN